MAQINVLYYRAGEGEPKTVSVSNSLRPLQKLVGGYIESIRLFDNVDLICNEWGKIENLAANRIVGDDIVYGNFFVTAQNNLGAFINLTAEQTEKVKQLMEEGRL